jgi:F1F0 ATPase subunit 2
MKMVDNSVQIIIVLLTGVGLGLFFYGGLWWTVSRSVDAPMAGILFGVSLLLRMGVVAAGFLLISHGSWVRALCCLIGFSAVRFVLTKIIQPKTETIHAP